MVMWPADTVCVMSEMQTTPVCTCSKRLRLLCASQNARDLCDPGVLPHSKETSVDVVGVGEI